MRQSLRLALFLVYISLTGLHYLNAAVQPQDNQLSTPSQAPFFDEPYAMTKSVITSTTDVSGKSQSTFKKVIKRESSNFSSFDSAYFSKNASQIVSGTAAIIIPNTCSFFIPNTSTFMFQSINLLPSEEELLHSEKSILALNNTYEDFNTEISVNNIDSLVSLWYKQHLTVKKVDETEYLDSDSIPDSVYIARLNNIPALIGMSYNPLVRDEIVRYTKKRGKEYMERMMGKANYYFPMYEEILDRYGLPLELKCLPIIESAINPVAISRSGAVGMWQFMPGTGKIYNLLLTKSVDERCDPVKSTHAAAQHLSNLYNRYGDWHLVLAAYNCGHGTVNRAIERSGGITNYWELSQFLPGETRKYVARYIAAVYLMNYYDKHQMHPISYDMPQMLDTVYVNNIDLNLNKVAEILEMPIEQLRDLNPQYRKDIIPAKQQPYPVTLPMTCTDRFIAYTDSISNVNEAKALASKEQPIQPKIVKVAVSQTTSLSKASKPKTHTDDKFIYYTIQKGDNFWIIAKKFAGVTCQDIMNINSFTPKTRINPGDVIKIKHRI